MPRYYRRAAGLVAVLAMSLSFAEAVWASTCMPSGGMELASMVMVGEGSSEETPRGSHCADPKGAPGGHDGTSCPFDSSGAARTCAGVVSLPSVSAALGLGSTSGEPPVFPVRTRVSLLIEGSLFRPPRA